MKLLRDTISSYATFSDAQLTAFTSKFHRKEIKQKDILIREGQYCNAVFFIEKGLLRIYCIKDDKEICTYFPCEGNFTTSFQSFVEDKPSEFFIEALEDGTIWQIAKFDLETIYAANPRLLIFGKLFAEYNYLCITKHSQALQHLTAKEKYLWFLESSPLKVRECVPNKFVASYLGLEPETLSRIKYKSH